MTKVHVLARRGILILGIAALIGLAWWLGVGTLRSLDALRVAPAASVDDVVPAAAGAVGALVSAWLALGAIVTVVQLVGGHRPRFHVLPSGGRTLIGWALGLGIVAGTVVPAGATTTTPVPAPTATPTAALTIDPGWSAGTPAPATSTVSPTGGAATASPGASPSTASATSTASPTRAAPSTTTTSPFSPKEPATPKPAAPAKAAESPRGTTAKSIVVQRGDSLWDIASRHLGEGATHADVAREWPRWYEQNRAVVGSDPDLIHPGQQLTAPVAPPSGQSDR